MIAGMVPMALGLGEGGEQTAPLGRAVIGGLMAATLTTLFVLPSCSPWCRAAAGPRPPRSTRPTRRAATTTRTPASRRIGQTPNRPTAVTT